MYDLKELKAIPLADVARRYNISLTQKGGRLWGKLREESAPSFSINIDKNLWYDFGSSKGGSTIDLLAEIEGITSKEAINKLAELFGVQNRNIPGWSPLTDSQYKDIGIEASLATVNFSYDLRVHTPQQLARWNAKYAIPVRELAEKYPDDYNYLVNKIAGDHIKEISDLYSYKLRLAAEQAPSSQRNLYISWAETDANEINRKYELLIRALKGVKPDRDMRADVQKDLKAIEKEHYTNALPNDVDVIKSKIVQNYRSLYNFYQAEFLTTEQAKDLYDLNVTVTKAEGKYLDVYEIRELYNNLGKKLQSIEDVYNNMIKQGASIKNDDSLRQEWNINADKLKSDLVTIKEIFNKCSDVIDGIRQANILYKINTSQLHNRDNIPLNSYNIEI